MRFTPNSILSITVVSVLPLCAIGAQGQVIMPQPADSAATEMLHEVTVTGSRHSGENELVQSLAPLTEFLHIVRHLPVNRQASLWGRIPVGIAGHSPLLSDRKPGAVGSSLDPNLIPEIPQRENVGGYS